MAAIIKLMAAGTWIQQNFHLYIMNIIYNEGMNTIFAEYLHTK